MRSRFCTVSLLIRAAASSHSRARGLSLAQGCAALAQLCVALPRCRWKLAKLDGFHRGRFVLFQPSMENPLAARSAGYQGGCGKITWAELASPFLLVCLSVSLPACLPACLCFVPYSPPFYAICVLPLGSRRTIAAHVAEWPCVSFQVHYVWCALLYFCQYVSCCVCCAVWLWVGAMVGGCGCVGIVTVSVSAPYSCMRTRVDACIFARVRACIRVRARAHPHVRRGGSCARACVCFIFRMCVLLFVLLFS